MNEEERRLAEIVVTPTRGNYTHYTGEETEAPTLGQYIASKQKEARLAAADHILGQDSPNVPIIPDRGLISRAAAYIFGMSNEERIRRFGTSDPFTCIYTATSQFNDKDALVSGNIAFRRNPSKYGFYQVPIDKAEEGDLIQFTDEVPHHSVIMTGRTHGGKPLISYSNGNSLPFDVIDEGDTVFTMVKNNSLNAVSDALGTPAAFRYVGTPEKQREWKKEYAEKYNGKVVGTPQFLNTKSEGGPLNSYKKWNDLSMSEKSEMMKIAVRNGITNLDEIKRKYNEFAEGGNLYAEGGNSDEDLVDWIIKEEGFLANPKDIGDGKITLGSGLTDPKWVNLYKKRGNKWSREDNRRAVAEEVASRRRWAEANIPNWDSLPNSSQKALLSYKYNYDFTKSNSPKLFKALEDSDLQEVARQMDATSRIPAFRKGLESRRRREQKWFLSDVVPVRAPKSYEPAPMDNTYMYNPFTVAVESTQHLPIMVPDTDKYITTHEITPTQDKSEKYYEQAENMRRFNALMNLISIPSNPRPQYVPQSNLHFNAEGPLIDYAIRANGGHLYDGTSEDSQQMENVNYYGNEEQENVPILDGGQLKEVVIRRSEDPIWILSQFNPKYKKTFFDMYSDNFMDKPEASRLLDVYNLAGRPEIVPLNHDEDRASIIMYPFGLKRTKIKAAANRYEGLEDVIAELAHPIQEKYGNNSVFIENLNPFYSGDDYRGKTRYDFPNTYESETHEDFEPLLNFFITQNILPGQEWNTYRDEGFLGNDTIIENPTLKQVVDSAKTYNRRKQDVDYKYIFPRSTPSPRSSFVSKLGNLW